MNERPIARPLAEPQRDNNTGTEAASEERQGSQRSRQQHGGSGRDEGLSGHHGGRAAHRKPCRRYETRRAGCLNGGRCFAIELHNGLRRPGCRYATVPVHLGIYGCHFKHSSSPPSSLLLLSLLQANVHSEKRDIPSPQGVANYAPTWWNFRP